MGTFNLSTLKMKVLSVFSCLVAATLAMPNQSAIDTRMANDEVCGVCKVAITKFDEWITSDKTEAEIVQVVDQICHTLGSLIAGFEETCISLVESQLPAIIEGLVEDKLNPTQVCTDMLQLCYNV